MSIRFTKEECEKIIDFRLECEEVLHKDFLGNYGFGFDGVSYRVWNIIRKENTQWIFDRMYEYFTETTGIKIKKNLYECHIHNYVKGEKFSRHSDVTYPTQIHNIGVCLNDNYEGGEFILYKPYYVLPKKQGEIYTFESKREHEVKEILNGERWSIICFLHHENVKYEIKGLI